MPLIFCKIIITTKVEQQISLNLQIKHKKGINHIYKNWQNKTTRRKMTNTMKF